MSDQEYKYSVSKSSKITRKIGEDYISNEMMWTVRANDKSEAETELISLTERLPLKDPQPTPQPTPSQAAAEGLALAKEDWNCPKCEKPMKKRSGKFGDFFGCSGYPNCTGTRDSSGVDTSK